MGVGREPKEVIMSTAPSFSFAASFGSHMVLQQAPARAYVWGFAPVDAAVVEIAVSGAGISTYAPATLSPFNASAVTWGALLPAISAHKTDGKTDAYRITAKLTRANEPNV